MVWVYQICVILSEKKKCNHALWPDNYPLHTFRWGLQSCQALLHSRHGYMRMTSYLKLKKTWHLVSSQTKKQCYTEKCNSTSITDRRWKFWYCQKQCCLPIIYLILMPLEWNLAVPTPVFVRPESLTKALGRTLSIYLPAV